MIIGIAAILTSLAALTGILAIGNGRHWDFTFRDYLRGKRNAILYLWVIGSTIFSICHAAFLVEYGMAGRWQPFYPGDFKWMVVHAIVGVLLTLAHIFVATTLAKEVGPVDKYLWGARSRAVS